MSTVPEYKISALQVDNTELEFQQEINLSVENIFSSSSKFSKQNLIDILDYLRVNSGFGIKKIVSGDTYTVPVNYEMVITEFLDIEGVLNVEGEVTIL